MKIQLSIKNLENIRNLTQEDLNKIQEIFEALVQSGGLTGVKGGTTMIHFDSEGIFQKIELKYFPWIRRKGGNVLK